MAADIPFVDAHVHLWDHARIRYPWLTPPFDDNGPNGSVAAIAGDYTLADYRADLAVWNVVGAVHVDAGADAAQALDETVWLSEIADAGGLPTGIVAFAALDDPAVEDVLARQSAHARVRGIRHIVNWHPDARRTYTPRDLTRDARWHAGYALLGRYDLSFDLQCYPGQMPGLASLIERHPDIPVVINHLGMPIVPEDEGLAEWRRGLTTLAALPHVSIKISGLGFIDRDWTTPIVAPLIHEAIDLFGTDRCLVASDMPTDTLFAPAVRYLAAYQETLGRYSEDERRDMFGRNANRVYRLGLDI